MAPNNHLYTHAYFGAFFGGDFQESITSLSTFPNELNVTFAPLLVKETKSFISHGRTQRNTTFERYYLLCEFSGKFLCSLLSSSLHFRIEFFHLCDRCFDSLLNLFNLGGNYFAKLFKRGKHIMIFRRRQMRYVHAIQQQRRPATLTHLCIVCTYTCG